MDPLIIVDHEKWHSESVNQVIPCVYTLFKMIVVARNTTKFDATNNIISVCLSKFNPNKLM